MTDARTARPTLVETVMTPDPVVIGADMPVREAARLMESHAISGLPVVDAWGAVAGVVSETDLLRVRSTEHLWQGWPGLTVRHLMHAPALTARRSTPLEEAAALMERQHVHRLVVVDDDGHTPVGIVSAADVVRAMVQEDEDA